MAIISRRRLHFATTGFLAEMRTSFATLHPDKECPIKNLEDYSPEQRSALMAGVQKAMQLSHPDADTAFAAWEERQSAAVD